MFLAQNNSLCYFSQFYRISIIIIASPQVFFPSKYRFTVSFPLVLCPILGRFLLLFLLLFLPAAQYRVFRAPLFLTCGNAPTQCVGLLPPDVCRLNVWVCPPTQHQGLLEPCPGRLARASLPLPYTSLSPGPPRAPQLPGGSAESLLVTAPLLTAWSQPTSQTVVCNSALALICPFPFPRSLSTSCPHRSPPAAPVCSTCPPSRCTCPSARAGVQLCPHWALPHRRGPQRTGQVSSMAVH